MQKVKKNFRKYKKIEETEKLIFQKVEKKIKKSKSMFDILSNNIFYSNRSFFSSVIMLQNEKKKKSEKKITKSELIFDN